MKKSKREKIISGAFDKFFKVIALLFCPNSTPLKNPCYLEKRVFFPKMSLVLVFSNHIETN